ncbi:MAG: hypothetical protein AAF583_01500 [Pseudomonadota bacterium]
MTKARDTAPRGRVIGDRIRIIWTDYGVDGMSIVATGEQDSLNLHSATALLAMLKRLVVEVHLKQEAEIKPLPRKTG